jgi:hypothetical protein
MIKDEPSTTASDLYALSRMKTTFCASASLSSFLYIAISQIMRCHNAGRVLFVPILYAEPAICLVPGSRSVNWSHLRVFAPYSAYAHL